MSKSYYDTVVERASLASNRRLVEWYGFVRKNWMPLHNTMLASVLEAELLRRLDANHPDEEELC